MTAAVDQNEKPCRPISFSAPLIAPIVRRDKIQTRRIIRPQPEDAIDRYAPTVVRRGMEEPGDDVYGACCPDGAAWRSPYGAPGDLLWVREPLVNMAGHVAYIADGARVRTPIADPVVWSWRPKSLASRYCPRWASRYTLEVTSISAERLQSITDADIRAEGITVEIASQRTGLPRSMLRTPHEAWRHIWDSLNQSEGDRWDDNPWVWVVGFKLVTP